MLAGVLVPGTRKAAGSAALVLVDGAVPLRPEPALFDAMLEGWRRQQAARRLTGPLVDGRVRLVRRFGDFTGAWPWQWTPGQVEQWIASAGGRIPRSVRMKARWRRSSATCAIRGTGGSPSASSRSASVRCRCAMTATWPFTRRGTRAGRSRPLTRAELQSFLDAADDHVERAASSRRKGWLAAFRDATLFKVVYGWGLRRRETAMLDVNDFTANPAAPELGGLGVCQVRYGKAMRAARRGGGRSPR